MRTEFDPDKDAGNIAKRGVSLALAASLDWDALLCRPDDRRDYKELREVGFARWVRACIAWYLCSVAGCFASSVCGALTVER
jgi:uncharacterized DUF497 family protein